MRGGWGVRGLGWWNGKVIVGTQDGRLIAIDGRTGRPVWNARAFDKGAAAYVSGAPRRPGDAPTATGRVLGGL